MSWRRIAQSKYDLYQMKNAYQYVEVEHCFSEDGHEYYDHLKSIEEAEYQKKNNARIYWKFWS